MTDLEMVKLCAEKMGIEPYSDGFIFDEHGHEYYPLTNDAQAFALVKRMGLSIKHIGEWAVSHHPDIVPYAVINKDLNRAIVECVSRLPD